METTAETAEAGAAAVPVPSPLRVLGLLALVLAILLLCWIDLSSAEQYGLVIQLIYPASLGVALVLLFDKATRDLGHQERRRNSARMAFLRPIGISAGAGFSQPAGRHQARSLCGSFWDILNLVLFFAGFWVLDRTSARSRFLVGYGYLIVVPLLLLVWQAVQGIAVPVSWWGSVWPFLILTVIFFLLEVVTLISSAGERQTLPALKDSLFVLLYAILLIVAIGAKSHA